MRTRMIQVNVREGSPDAEFHSAAGKPLAVTRLPALANDDNGFAVTHLPSGMALVRCVSREAAREAVKAFLALPVDWTASADALQEDRARMAELTRPIIQAAKDRSK